MNRIDYERMALSNNGHMILLRSLLLRARQHINSAALEARINDRPIDSAGEALIRDIDAATTIDHSYDISGS